MLTHFDSLQYGDHTNIEVLLDVETNELWVTQATIRAIMNWDDKRAPEKLSSKSLKAFAGEGYKTPKSVKAKDVTGKQNTFKAIPFDAFLTVIKWQAKLKEDRAIDLLIAGFADSFSSIILDQCGITLTVKDRQKVISHYLNEYHELFDWICDEHLRVYGVKPEPRYYRNVNVTIDRLMFNVSHFECNRKKNASTQQIWELESTHRWILEKKIKKGWGQEIRDPGKRVIAALQEMLG